MVLRVFSPCHNGLLFFFTLSLYTLGKARPMRAMREVKVIVQECVG
jgi:hypothetical protein